MFSTATFGNFTARSNSSVTSLTSVTLAPLAGLLDFNTSCAWAAVTGHNAAVRTTSKIADLCKSMKWTLFPYVVAPAPHRTQA
ncbi:hypothetical protein ACFQX6_09895 [Streptosporangium lutulentum]